MTEAAPGGGVFGVGIGSFANGLDLPFLADLDVDADAGASAFAGFDSDFREARVACRDTVPRTGLRATNTHPT